MSENWGEAKINLQLLAEKMLKAGWGKAFKIDDQGIIFERTALGQRRLKQIWRIATEMDIQPTNNFDVNFLVFLARREALLRDWK